jgi:hypothetical protein
MPVLAQALLYSSIQKVNGKNGGMNVNLTLIQTSSVALSVNQAAAFFHGPIPIVSNFDLPVEKEPAIPATRLLSDRMPDQILRADRFGSAADVLARFGLAASRRRAAQN